MAEVFSFAVQKSGLRLDVYLSQERKDLSRSYIQRLIREGYVRVNSNPARASLKLKPGDRVELTLPPPPPSPLSPEAMPLSILYEDDDLMVIDKPPGIAVHPAPGHPGHTLVNALLAYNPSLPGEGLRPGIVHRLDKDTSGLMVVAKKSAAQRDLQTQLKARSVVKKYLVLVQGRPSAPQGTIEAPIGRDPHHRQRMAVVVGGREASTSYRVVDSRDNYSLLEVTTHTGRTHQIRVHLSAIGLPVVGDAVYGKKVPFLSRQFLHACYLGFKLPSTGLFVEFRSALPPDLERALKSI